MKTEKVELRVTKGEKEWIKLVAEDNDLTQSELIMKALKSWVMEHYPKDKIKKWIP